MQPRFFIEQIAICPPNAEAARELMSAIGAHQWHLDHVTGQAFVFGEHEADSQANLQFNYELGREDGKPLEFEILEYTKGSNWMDDVPSRVSHLGMHCSMDELDSWIDFFQSRRIQVAQMLNTETHTNPAIAGKRQYTYAIFNTYPILGVDLKFIVRRDVPQQ